MSSEQEKHPGFPETNKIKEALDRSRQDLQRLATFYQRHRQDNRAKEILRAIKKMKANEIANNEISSSEISNNECADNKNAA